jgi:hypothetical protein
LFFDQTGLKKYFAQMPALFCHSLLNILLTPIILL